MLNFYDNFVVGKILPAYNHTTLKNKITHTHTHTHIYIYKGHSQNKVNFEIIYDESFHIIEESQKNVLY